MSRLLIVNADDFGLTAGAPALGDVPALGVGVHLAVVGEDPPLLSAKEIPTLVDGQGLLDLSWRRFLRRAFIGRVDVDDIEREATAQIDAVADALPSRALTHLDTHQHLHLWPPFGRLVVDLAGRRHIPAVRVTRSRGRSLKGKGVNRLANRFAGVASAAGLHTTEVFAGFDEGGTLAVDALVQTIDVLGATGAATAELGMHPGERNDADLARYEWGYRWGDELDATMAAATRAAVERNGFTLGSYAALGSTS